MGEWKGRISRFLFVVTMLAGAIGLGLKATSYVVAYHLFEAAFVGGMLLLVIFEWLTKRRNGIK